MCVDGANMRESWLARGEKSSVREGEVEILLAFEEQRSDGNGRSGEAS